MTTAIRFAALEIAMQRPYLKSHLVPLLIVIAIITVINPGPLGALGLCAGLAMLIPSYMFSLDERGRLDTLYSVLPLSRTNVVHGRYVVLLALTLALLSMGAVLTAARAALTGPSVDLAELAIVFGGSFFLVAIVHGFQVPFYFAVGYSKARIVNYAILIVFFGALWLVFPAVRLDMVHFTDRLNSPFFYAITVLGGLGILGASVASSSRLYRNRVL